jgi:Ca2+-binding EF-hand superfamily protein
MSKTIEGTLLALVLGMLAVVAYAQSPPPAADGGSKNAVEFIKGLDKDEDGVLSMEEVAETPLKADFDDIDTDKDGKLTASELEAFTPKNTGS